MCISGPETQVHASLNFFSQTYFEKKNDLNFNFFFFAEEGGKT